MAHGGSRQHKKAIWDYIEELRAQGYKAINLNNFSPDGIAVKDGKLFAIEVLITNGKKYVTNAKKNQYSMFDEVLVKKIPRDKFFEKKLKAEEDKIYTRVKKIKEEEEINEAWNKYG